MLVSTNMTTEQRNFEVRSEKFKVVVIGTSGSYGQSVSLSAQVL